VLFAFYLTTAHLKRIFLISSFISLAFLFGSHAQIIQDSNTTIRTGIQNITSELKGLVLDEVSHSPLPYASIYVLHKNKGVISNETGAFSLDITDLDKTDTICFQYIGYQTRCLSVSNLDTSNVVYLKVDIINLKDVLVFGNAPDPESIVKKVLENKDLNYKTATARCQIFIRNRDITDIEGFNLAYKKSTIPELDRKFLKSLEDNIPKHSTSYMDFLGNLYFTMNQEDSVKLKVDPVKTVELKEKEIDELKQYEPLFKDLFSNTGEKEYWQIKSGVFGQKFDNDELKADAERDTLNDNKRELHYFGRSIESEINYSTLNDKDQWDFLYHTGRYDFTLAGGASVNGEDVYIIDFKPRNSGLYTGRVYISSSTFALVRADYEYASGKIGRNIQLLGIGYTQTQFSGSIFFEKKDDNYLLKYFSKREDASVSINRNLALYQKKKRFLWDEKLNEFKVGINLNLDTEGSFEYLVMDYSPITEKQFEDFKQPEKMEVLYVDQFNDKLWRGYSIIEPTQQMKEYRKQGFEPGK
jgi:hypothetical protein